jgi:hypothetical protein
METKEYRMMFISELHLERRNFFEGEAGKSIKALKEEITTKEKRIEELEEKVKDYKGGEPTEDQLISLSEIRDLKWDIDWAHEHIFAVNEMSIIYLFKHLEIGIKKLIEFVHPNANTKELFRWDIMQSFFKGKGIIFSELKGYSNVNQLRKLNNAFKHGDLSSVFGAIPEFPDYFYGGNEAIEKFYNRVRPEVDLFQQSLSEAVKKEQFDFSEERLGDMATEYFGRMDKETAERFAEVLKKKWGNT